jgi:hypothetical protein
MVLVKLVALALGTAKNTVQITQPCNVINIDMLENSLCINTHHSLVMMWSLLLQLQVLDLQSH